MNFIEALKTGLVVKYPRTLSYKDHYLNVTSHIAPNCWIDPVWLLSLNCLSKEDLLAEDWEVQKEEKVVGITKSKFLEAVKEVMIEKMAEKCHVYHGPYGNDVNYLDVQNFEGWPELMKKLGL